MYPPPLDAASLVLCETTPQPNDNDDDIDLMMTMEDFSGAFAWTSCQDGEMNSCQELTGLVLEEMLQDSEFFVGQPATASSSSSIPCFSPHGRFVARQNMLLL